MPSYEYECSKCGQKFEALQTFEEYDRHVDHERHQPLKCPECGSKKVERHMGSPVFVITSRKS